MVPFRYRSVLPSLKQCFEKAPLLGTILDFGLKSVISVMIKTNGSR